jgi:hypothetical protein
MSHYYGTLKGCAGRATRRGHKSSGIQTTAACWQGAVSVWLHWNEAKQCNEYSVELGPWHGAGPDRKVIAEGSI